MAVIAFPSENAVGSLFGSPTQIVREQAMAAYAKTILGSSLKSYVMSGFTLSAISASNGVRLSYGSGGHYAMIDGTMISFDADVDLTGLSNNTHFVYAQLTRSSSLVTTWALVANTTGTTPSDSVPLGRVVVAGGVAGSPQSAAKNPIGCYASSYVGDGTGSRYIFLGYRAKMLLIPDNSTPASIILTTQWSSLSALFTNGNSDDSGRQIITVGSTGITIGELGFTLTTANAGSTTYNYLAFV